MKGSCAWVRPLTSSANRNTRVFLFHYQLEVDGSSLWDQLLSQSYALISGLDEGRALPGVRFSPQLHNAREWNAYTIKTATPQTASLHLSQSWGSDLEEGNRRQCRWTLVTAYDGLVTKICII